MEVDNESVPATNDKSKELGAFLKARRADLMPESSGVEDGGRRRKVTGLRREEVARLAAISVDYYTRLEQGRVQASASVLVTLAQALRLSDDQQTYLYELAGKADARPRRRRAEQVRPAMQRLLDRLIETPAFVMGKRMHILAWNASATALYLNFADIAPRHRNYIRLMFTHPVMRALHQHWDHDAHDTVSVLRMEAARDPDDPELAQLVGELSLQDPDFRHWWGAHDVASTSHGQKRYRHALVGDLALDCDTWSSPDGSGQRLVVLTAEPGTPSFDKLRILGSWTTVNANPAPM